MTGERPEPVWLPRASVVRYRRYGEGGQELRPGTKAYRGGARVYVIGAYYGMGCETVTTVGHGRHTRGWITIDMVTRNLCAFRPALVYTPAVLRRWAESGDLRLTEESAAETAASLDRLAARYRAEHFGDVPHPDPCLCPECLAGAEG